MSIYFIALTEYHNLLVNDFLQLIDFLYLSFYDSPSYYHAKAISLALSFLQKVNLFLPVNALPNFIDIGVFNNKHSHSVLILMMAMTAHNLAL